jgi:hypothetical protein
VPVIGALAPTRALRRAGAVTVAAEGIFVALCLVTAQVHAVRLTNPWNADPYDAVVSSVILVLPVVALPTLVRLLAHRAPALIPAAAARAVLAGCLSGLACMAAALLACTAALLAPGEGGISAPAGVLLLASTAAGVAATGLVLRARDLWAPALARLDHVPATARPDLADELATLTASLLPGSVPARAAAWLDKGLDAWRLSPRRHPWAAVVAAAAAAGALVAQWHALREGPWAGATPALVFAGAVAVTVGAGLAAGVAWLGLLRPAGARPVQQPA